MKNTIKQFQLIAAIALLPVKHNGSNWWENNWTPFLCRTS